MRGLVVLFAAIVLCVIAAPAYALDYPHFTINNIGCDSCHFVYGTQPSLLPPWTAHTPQDIDDTQYNTLCWSCHNDIDAPYMRTHSSLQTDNSYGNWTVECRVCHDPHYQDQFRKYGSDSYLYSGVSTTITSTTITKTGAGWTVDAYAGLVVVPNVLQMNYNYKIVSNTLDTLTVQGPINLTKVTVGNTFAIVYGNLISDAIDLSKITIIPAKSGSKTTRFFNTTGSKSFADGDGIYDGVCEVCHTQTTHFRNNGGGSDPLHTNMGAVVGTRCTNCHMHVNGFMGMGGGVHKTHVTDEKGPKLACVDCHGANTPPMLADGQNLSNTTVCNNCHSVIGAVTAKTYWQNDPGNWTTTGGESGYCGSCHDETPGNSKQNGTGDTAANIIGNNTTYGYFITGHGKTTGSYQRLSWQATLAYGNSAANRSCSACHDLSTPHYNSANKRLKPGYENDSSNSNCRQCHNPGTAATAEPEWYTTYAEYQNSAHKNKKCSDCHDVHGASGNYPGMTKANQESLCYQCHTQGGVQNNAMSGSGLADDIQQAFSLSSKHDLGTSFSLNFESYYLECVSCHNVHIVTGKYWDAASGKSPVTRFTSNTAVWGDGTGEKMDDYVGSGIYQTPYADVFPGYILPDYPTFCLDCHSSFGGSGQGGVNWGSDKHGKGAANNPGGNQGPYPDYWGIWAQGQIYDANPPAFKVPVGRGFVSFTYQPWDQERRIAGGNFVLSCTDCHEAHGASNGSMTRTIIRPGTSEPGAESPATDPASGAPTACQVCHGVKIQEHNGGLFGCGSASCHQTANIHRLAVSGSNGGTTIFNREHVADIRFENSLDDSGTWRMHGRWVDDGNLQSTNSSLNPNDEYLAKFVPGKSGQAFSFDGDDVVELGTRGAFSEGFAQTAAQTGMAKAFELTDTGTIQAWIYPTDLTGTKTIASNAKENSKNYVLMIKDDVPGVTGPRLVFHADTADMYESDHGAYSSVTIPLNEWTHVAAVYNRWTSDGKKIKLYVNGTDVTANTGSEEYSQPLTQCRIEAASWWSNSNMQPFLLGGHPVNFDMFQGITCEMTDYFQGKIDEFNVYNTAKNPSQIRQSIGPVLVSAKGKIGSDQLTIAFSRGVYTDAGASGSLTSSDFILTDTDDSRTILSVSHTAGASTATLTLSSPFDSLEDLFVDKLKVASNTVFDSGDNPAISLDVVITARSNIKGAIAKDSSGIAGIQAGDKVIIKFDIATQGTAITNANINSVLSLSNSHSWLSGSGAITSAVWSTTTNSNDTLTITLSASGGTPSVAPGDIITLDGTIRDASGVLIQDSHVISGTFGPLPDGAVGYWNMVENYGDGAYDSTDYENHGTLINVPSWTTGVYDSAIYFDGDDDYVEVPDSASLDLSREGTLEVWAKKDNNKAYQVYLAKYATSGSALANFGYVLADVDGKIAVKWGEEDDVLTSDCVTVQTGVWNHILATYDGTQMKIFLNGQPIKTGSFIKKVIANAYPLRIGAKGAGDSYDSLFEGTIDEAVVYNRALTNDEVRARYGAEVSPKSAIVYDMNSTNGIQTGDKVKVKFDGPTNGATINASNINTILALNNGHVWGTISSTAWSTSVFTNDTLTITLSTSGVAPTIAPVDTITTDGSVLKDLWGDSITATIGVGGKFGPLPSGAVAYYEFNEGSGTTVNDATLNENHGVVRGAGSWINGRTGGGKALDFNGTDTHVFIQDCGTSLDLTTEGTLEFWMRKDSSPTNTYPSIIGKGQPVRTDGTGNYAAGNLSYNLYSSSNEERLTLYWGGSGGPNTGYSNDYLSINGGWKHVVVTYDGDARFYIDGEYVGGSRAGTLGLVTNEPVILGASAYFSNVNFFLDGAIDEAVIYNRKLSPEEVRENSGIPWAMKSAVAYDVGGADGIQAGDRVVITFNGPTQATQITSANIDTALDLPIGKTWKSGSGAIGNAVWSTNKFTNDTLTIILSDTGGAPNVAVGNSITLDGVTVKDNMGRVIPVGSVIISGTFNPLSGDIVAYWNFAEGSGTTANDSSIYKNHGTLQGDATWTAGQDDGALRLDGSNAYVRVNDSNSLDLVTRDFYGIRLASRTKGWAVGQSGAILNYTGTVAPGGGTHTWSMEYYSPTMNHLYAVDNYSATEAYAVGAGGTIIRYNGSSWGNLSNPVAADLYSVDMLSSTSGWAVGKSNTILRFNGSAWSQQSISSPTATWTLKSVKMLSASEGWAAGGDNVSTGVILRWNGSTWTEFATTTLTNMLTSIDMFNSTNGWAVGLNGKILKYDGSSWTQFTSPVAYDLHAVKALTATEAWAVGANRTIMMYNGTAWTVQSDIMEVSGLPALRAFDSVAADPGDDSEWYDYTKFDFVAGDSNSIIKHSDGTWISSEIRGMSWHGATVPTYDGATFEIWAKKNSNKNDQTYLAKQYPDPNTIGQISYRIKEDGSTGKPAFTWNNYANTPNQLICSNAAATGQWNNIIVTVNSGAQRIYLNGQLCGTKTYGNAGLATLYPLLIGSGYYGSADLDGDIDQTTIYNRALSGDEVWSRYTSATGSTAVTFKSATADDNSGGGAGIHAGDRVVIMFNGPTAATPVSSANINTVLNVAGKTWLSGNGSVSTAWSTTAYTNDTLTITLSTTGGAPTVAVGDTITLSGGLNNSLGQPMTGSIAISGSFGTDILSWILDTQAEWKAGSLADTMPVTDSVTLTYWDVITFDIRSVDMLSPSEGWAVGEKGAVRKFDGTEWKAFASPLPFSGGSLNSVDMLSSTLGWAVGDSGKIIRFDGTKWTEETSPVTTALHSVKMVSSTEGWAVGASGKILNWDGTSWTTVTSPVTGTIYAIDTVSSAESWAGGTLTTNILKWDGTSWTTVTLPASATIRSIHMLSSSDGWAVGDSGKIFRYNGSAWSSVSSPTTLALYSVRMVSANDGWAVGGGGSSTNPGIILRWNGSAWSTFSTPSMPQIFYAINMLSASNGWAFGRDGVAFRYNGTSWSEYTTVFLQYINDMLFTSDTDGWAVGAGNVLRYNGNGWLNVYNPTPKSFADIDMLSATEGWVAGPNDYFYRYLNGSWASFANPASVWMNGIDMVTSNDGWAVGDSGKILRWNGTSWSEVASPTTNSLRAIKMLSSNEGWAVGNSGVILKWDGSIWTTVASPTSSILVAIEMLSPTEGWAVGYEGASPFYGTMLKYDGSSWSQVSIPTSAKGLQDIRMRSSSEGMAVGYSGAVLTYDGTSWKYSETPDTSGNYSAAYTPSGTQWVAGYAMLSRRVVYFPQGAIVNSFDAGATVDWLTHSYDTTTPSGTSVSFRWATSNDAATWSSWTSNFNSLADSRYIKQEAAFTTSDTAITPTLNRTTIQYHPDLIAGTVAYWFFDEGAGTTVTDTTGHSNTISFSSNPANERPSWTTGKHINALYFDGTDDRGFVAYNTTQNLGTADFTIETWLKFPSQVDIDTGGVGGAPISQRWSTGTGYEVVAGYPTSGKIRFKVNADYVDTLTDGLNDDTWRHFVFIREGTSLKVYVNGVLDNTASTSAGSVDTARGISIGYARVWPDDYYSNWYKGTIDRTVIYNRALTTTEISERYTTGMGPIPSVPTIGTASALSTTSIRWGFTDNAGDEEGFKLHDSSHTVKTSSATVDLTYLDETGLTANTQYTRHIHAYNANGNSSGSADASKYTLSNDPAGASATDETYSDKITVSWSSGGSQSGYRVYRDGTSGAGTQVYDGTDTSFDDTITGPHTYYVYSKNGDSVLSAGYSSDSGSTGTASAAPTIGAPSALSTTSIRWNFTDNASNETGFKVHDASHTVKASSATVDLTYLDETGLTANTQYTRHVHSYNGIGDSTGSADASAHTLSAAPNITADKSTSTWYATTDVILTNAAGFGSSGVQYYRYAWDQSATHTFTDSETQWTTSTLTKTSTADGSWYLHVKSFNGDNVANGTQTYGPFYYDGSAPTGLGNSSPSNGATDQATNVTVNSSTATDSGSGSVQYYFQVALDSGFTSGVQNSGWQAGASFAPALSSGTTYYWHVKARDGLLNETAYTSTWSFATVFDAPVIGTPLVLSTTSIRWSFSDNASGETGFRVHDASHAVKASAATPNLTYLDETGLTANTQYTRHVHAYNAGGDSLPSNEASLYALSNNPVSASASDGTYPDKITVSWSSGGAQSGYRVYRDGDKDSGTQVYNGGSTTFDDSTTGTYSYYVYSLNGDGVLSSGYVNDSGFTSGGGDSTPPSQVTGLSAVGGTTSTSMNLTWTAATDTGGSGLAGYKIERADNVSGAPGAYTEIGTSVTNLYTDSTVSASTPYWYKVRAYDNASNNGNYSTDTYSAGITWTLQFDGGNLKRVAYSSSLSRYVAVGVSGRILTSPDGQTWTYRTSGTTMGLGGILWSGAQFVAVGEAGTVLTSPDGITWTTRVGSGTLNGVAWSGSLSLYVAAGNSGVILTSPDGVTWTSRTSGTTNLLYAVTWSGTQFVAVGASGTNIRSNDGVSWTVNGSAAGRSNPLRDIIWGGGWFVVPGQDGGVYKSADGINWSFNNFAGSTQFYSAAHDGTTYVVTGQNGVLYTSVDLTTWTPRASGTSISLNGVVWSGTRFVAAGDYSTVTSSADGLSWTVHREGPSATFSGVAWSGSTAVAAGTNGATYTSSDLTNWTNSRIHTNLNSIVWSDTHSQFVEVGAGGVIRTSTDGLSWTGRNSGTTNNLTGLAWTGSQYVAVGVVGTILTSSDGITWTSRTSGVSTDLYAVAWSQSRSELIATGTQGTIIMSSDGITWSPRTDADISTAFNYLTLKGVVWTGSQYITAGTYGKVYISPDGATDNWTLIADADIGTNTLNAIVWSGSQYIIVGNSGKIFTSPDAATDNWTLRTSGITNTLSGIVWTGSQFVTVGGGATASNILTSPDGVTWTARTAGSNKALYSVVWSGTRFVVVGNTGVTDTSADGVTWTYSGVGLTIYGVVWDGTKFVAVGAGSTVAPATILTSTDGVDWTGRSSGTANNITLRGVVSTGTQFAAVGQSGNILTSPDAVTWTSRTSGTSNYLYGIAWTGTQFAAVGASGTVLTSPDGINWTTQTSGTANTLYGVAWSGSRFAAAGASGTIITSPDGVTWTTQTSGTANQLNGITWTGSQFAATGNSSTILTSPDGVTWLVRPSPATVHLNCIVWSAELSRLGAVGATGTVYTSP